MATTLRTVLNKKDCIIIKLKAKITDMETHNTQLKAEKATDDETINSLRTIHTKNATNIIMLRALLHKETKKSAGLEKANAELAASSARNEG